MTKVLLSLLAVTATSFSPSAFATVVVSEEAGKPVTATWPSGNQAELKLNRNALIEIPIPFVVSENTCRSDAGQSFNTRFSLRADRLTYVWTKHSNPERVGKPVKLKGTETSLSNFFFIGGGLRFRFPGLAAGIPSDLIEPADMGFVPGLEGPFQSFVVKTWMSEGNHLNPETGISENRILASLSDVQIEADGKIGAIGSAEELVNDGNPFMLLGDVVSWLIETPKGLCQISFKPDVADANRIATEYVRSLPDKFEPYLWQMDELSAWSKIKKGASLTNIEFLEGADD